LAFPVFRNIVVLVDFETHGVYCGPESHSHANALRAGLINAGTFELGSTLPWKKSKYTHITKLGSLDKHYCFNFDTGELYDMPEELITPDWIESKRLVNLRYNFMLNWDFRTRRRTIRINDYHSVGIMEGFLWDQYRQCCPEENYYTPAIYEWADLSETSVENAFQELKMRSESIGLVHLRINAIYHKYIHKLNQCNTHEELDKVFTKGCEELERRSWL
jgi:hypothetical protein